VSAGGGPPGGGSAGGWLVGRETGWSEIVGGSWGTGSSTAVRSIFPAAREAFGELGYDAATFQVIAIRADLTRPAINHDFANKRVLYDEVVANTNEMLVVDGMTKSGEQKSLLKRLSAFFSAAMQVDSVDRSAAAFLTTSLLEAQRHPELGATRTARRE
jgi:AcrR family transcriptional regulator